MMLALYFVCVLGTRENFLSHQGGAFKQAARQPVHFEEAMFNPLTYGFLLTSMVLGIVILILAFEKFWIKRKSPVERGDGFPANLVEPS